MCLAVSPLCAELVGGSTYCRNLQTCGKERRGREREKERGEKKRKSERERVRREEKKVRKKKSERERRGEGGLKSTPAEPQNQPKSSGKCLIILPLKKLATIADVKCVIENARRPWWQLMPDSFDNKKREEKT